MILGTNVLKHLLRRFKQDPSYWRVMNQADSSGEQSIEQFLSMLSGITRWKGDRIPDTIGTVKLTSAVTLMPRHEHIVWGKLPSNAPVSEGSAIVVEPSRSQSHRKNILVGRTVASMSGDRWVPVKVVNPSDKPVTLRRNMKLADVSPCVALEDFELKVDHPPDTELKTHNQSTQKNTDHIYRSPVAPTLQDSLSSLGLADIDVNSCEVSPYWKGQLVELIQKYEDVFSKDKLDCGQAKDFVHRIHLTDDRPFRLPYRRVPPGQYQKLRQTSPRWKRRTSYVNPPTPHSMDWALYFLKSRGRREQGTSHRLCEQPFVKPRVGERLMAEPYGALLEEAEQIQDEPIRNVFRMSANCQGVNQCTSEVGSRSMSSEEVTAVLDGQIEWEKGPNGRVISWLIHDVQKLIPPGLSALPVFSLQELQEKQQGDAVLARVIHYVTRGRRPSRRERVKEPLQVLKTLKQWDKLKMLDGILYRVLKDSLTGKRRYQYVTAAALVKQALQGVHDEAGHQGQYRTLYLAKQRFFWVEMERDVRDYVKTCKRCVVSKTPEPEGRAPLESIKTTSPLEIVCIDFWSAEVPNGKNVDVLVVTDHFTKMAHAFPCHDQSAKQVARQLWDRYFCVYGFPERIHSDQGANFESQLIQELLLIAGVKKSRTTAYHPMGNGAVERFNRTLGGMIRALPPRLKQKWPQMLQTLTFAYNCTAHESTGYAPFYLMYGRTPRLPVDVMFHNVERDCDIVDYDKYVLKLREDLREALSSAQANAVTSQQHQAEVYNRRTKGHDIMEGDQVLLSNKGVRGCRKLADKWESIPYVVVARDPKCHTYRIKNTSSGHEKVVHRNLLLCANFLPLELEDEDVESSFAESADSSTDMTGSGVSEVATDVIEDRTTNWVLDSTVPSPPSECPGANEESEDVELDDSVSQRESVVDGMFKGNGPLSSVFTPF
ncbi:hypothetical protein AAFF_G00037260 [Aldrovandia affinis]|uniref:Gypsy retrotransposon integrase-like protein 1 n=1 Tax=Aldrovandia affinis TaxID=143900 RepID=A0AAD7X049_9TELE|nr:hypothetical protein AAFF_G00037260 [Aldrovandia affinis]